MIIKFYATSALHLCCWYELAMGDIAVYLFDPVIAFSHCICFLAYVVSTMADIYESTLETALTTFTSVDAQSYVPVGVKKRKVKHNIFDFAVDGQNCFVTAIEVSAFP